MIASLWSPIAVGDIWLEHRLAMAPMTRGQARPDGVPTLINAKYYAKRASAPLIIAEGSQPSADGQIAHTAVGSDRRSARLTLRPDLFNHVSQGAIK